MNRKKGRERKNQKVSHSPPLPPKKKVPTKKNRSKRKSKTSDFYLCALYSWFSNFFYFYCDIYNRTLQILISVLCYLSLLSRRCVSRSNCYFNARFLRLITPIRQYSPSDWHRLSQRVHVDAVVTVSLVDIFESVKGSGRRVLFLLWCTSRSSSRLHRGEGLIGSEISHP